MNRSPWGRRNNDFVRDLQALAFWVVIIGVVGYLLFPSFFHSLFGWLTLPSESSTQASQQQTEPTTPQSTFPTVFEEVYGSGQLPQLSSGYWAIFIRDGQFEQLALSEQTFGFLQGLIEKDRANGKQKLILSANGQIQQVLVSDEIYDILNQLAVVSQRNQGP